VALPVKLILRSRGKKLAEYENDFLFTHFGFSGPGVLDISRHWIREKMCHPRESGDLSPGFPTKSFGNDSLILEACFLPEETEEGFLRKIIRERETRPGRQVKTFLSEFLPQRFVEVILKKTGVREDTVFNQLAKESRQSLLNFLFKYPLPVTGALGYQKAEVTAGGVDLAEVQRRTLESKYQPGLFFAGEMLDVDGRIGGFNFQWAWSSGVVAGLGAAEKIKSGVAFPRFGVL